MTLKRTGLLILINMFLWAQVSYANDTDYAKYKSANEDYKESRYNDAIEKYSELVSDGFVSDDLFANLGNGYLKLDKTAHSILNFEKSILINPNNKQALQNLPLAKESIIQPISVIDDFILVTMYRNITKQLSVIGWITLHLICLVLVFLMTILYWTHLNPILSEKLRQSPYSLIIMTILILLSLLFLITAVQRQNQLHGENYGIVMTEGISLLDGPDERSNEVITLSEGIKGKVLDKIDSWYKLELEDKDVGWIPQSEMQLIRI